MIINTVMRRNVLFYINIRVGNYGVGAHGMLLVRNTNRQPEQGRGRVTS